MRSARPTRPKSHSPVDLNEIHSEGWAVPFRSAAWLCGDFSAIFWTATVLWCMTGPALAASADSIAADQSFCENAREDPTQVQVDACTRRLAETSLSPADRARTLFFRSKAQSALGARDAALADMDEAIPLDGSQATFFLHRADLHRAKGDLENALADYGAAIQRDPDDRPALEARADLLMAGGRDRDALADFDTILRLAPDDAKAYRQRGTARWRSLNFGEASATAGTDSGFAFIQKRLCVEVHQDCPDVALALADLGHAIDLQTGPERAATLLVRGAIFAARDDIPRALTDYDDAVRLRPLETTYKIERAEVRRRAGDLAGALADLDEALRLRGVDTRTLVQRAVVRKQSGDLEGARGDLDAALRQPVGGGSADWQIDVRRLRRSIALPGEAGMETELKDLTVSAVGLIPDQPGYEAISVRFDADSATRLAAFTTAHVGSVVQLLIGGTVVFEPRILDPILKSSVVISGMFTHEQAQSLASKLDAGAAVLIRAID